METARSCASIAAGSGRRAQRLAQLWYPVDAVMLGAPVRAVTACSRDARLAEAPYDAVVVGAGPNGLAAAIVLARGRAPVCVVEGAETVGGGYALRPS